MEQALEYSFDFDLNEESQNQNELKTINEFTFDEKELEVQLANGVNDTNIEPPLSDFDNEEINVDHSFYESTSLRNNAIDTELDKQIEAFKKSLRGPLFNPDMVTSPGLFDTPSQTIIPNQQALSADKNNYGINDQNGANIFDLQLKVQSLETENQKLLAENQDLESKIENLQNQVDAVKSHNNVQNSEQDIELITLQIKKELYTEKQKQLIQMKSDFDETLSRLKREHQQREEQYQSKIQELLKNSTRRPILVSQYCQTEDNINKILQESVKNADRVLQLESQILQLNNQAEDQSKLTFNLQIQIENQNTQLDQLKSDLNEKDLELADLNIQVEQQLDNNRRSIEKVKQKCTQAYEDAVNQLKDEYKKVIDTLKQKIEFEKNEKFKLRDQLKKSRIIEQQLEEYKTKIKQIQYSHLKEIQKLESKHDSEVQDIKNKYLETLQKMRQDASMAKSRTEERYRREIQEINNKWEERLTMSQIRHSNGNNQNKKIIIG